MGRRLGCTAFFICTTVLGVDRYVVRDGPTISPYDTWDKAASNIQIAVDAAVTGETVWVSNGVYSVDSMIEVRKDIRLVGYGGAAATVIDGRGTHGCFLLEGRVGLDGFTVTNGNAVAGSGIEVQW